MAARANLRRQLIARPLSFGQSCPSVAPMTLRTSRFLYVPFVALVACEKPSQDTASPAEVAPVSVPFAPDASVATLPAPEIIVDRTNVDVGRRRLPAGEPGLGDRVEALVHGEASIEGCTIDVVAMRAARPSAVVSVVDALRRSKASAVNVKTEARDGTTLTLPVSLSGRLSDCATVAWITKDASVVVWPAGGGLAKRVPRGLAGPDLTLGLEAMHKCATACEATQFAAGADDAMGWGLVFDLALGALHAAWTRTTRLC